LGRPAGDDLSTGVPPIESLPGMAAVRGLVHGVTTRAGGGSVAAFASLNLGRGTGDDEGRVARNRHLVAAALGYAGLTVPHQVHGTRIRRVDRPGEDPGACDGLSTDRPGILLGVLGADCPGLLLVDPVKRVLVVAHAGWHGVAGDVVRATLEHLRDEYGVAAARVAVGIGPGISAARYEVSDEVATQLAAALPVADTPRVIHPGRRGHAHVDLVEALRRQLVAHGVSATRIGIHGACTFEDARFYSHRRDEGVTGRHALLAGWTPTA